MEWTLKEVKPQVPTTYRMKYTTTSLFYHLAQLFTSSIQLGYIQTECKLATLRM